MVLGGLLLVTSGSPILWHSVVISTMDYTVVCSEMGTTTGMIADGYRDQSQGGIGPAKVL
jgi:hypothetical protein